MPGPSFFSEQWQQAERPSEQRGAGAGQRTGDASSRNSDGCRGTRRLAPQTPANNHSNPRTSLTEERTHMRQRLRGLLATPQRGTAKWRAMAVAIEVANGVLFAAGTVLIARACGGLTQMEGNIHQYFALAAGALMLGRFTIGPAGPLLQKLVAPPD